MFARTRLGRDLNNLGFTNLTIFKTAADLITHVGRPSQQNALELVIVDQSLTDLGLVLARDSGDTNFLGIGFLILCTPQEFREYVKDSWKIQSRALKKDFSSSELLFALNELWKIE
ncbi:MAG: hypothetical protein EOP05_11910 [Proteobacteria bacterium]|nr:MAG: hypothetical protein EOP05_11910 [Pseudomonadota bacterium]